MTRLIELKKEFAKLGHFAKHERMLELCGLLTVYFKEDKIKPIIVGGLSVEIYTRNNYMTHDIDLITDGRHQFDKLLIKELGSRKEGRSWYHEGLELAIEIPDNYLEGDYKKIIRMQLNSGRYVFVIGIEDIIIHRLESALVSQPKNPDWTDDYEWAERMFHIHKYDTAMMDLKYLLDAAKEVRAEHIITKWLKR